MPFYDVLETEIRMSDLINDVESGREKDVIIARNGRPAVRMTTVEQLRKPRRLGLAEGKYADFDDSLETNAAIQLMFDESKIDWL